jgi:hypothetical protein
MSYSRIQAITNYVRNVHIATIAFDKSMKSLIYMFYLNTYRLHLIYFQILFLTIRSAFQTAYSSCAELKIPWLPKVLVSFILFPLVFILREAKITSGGKRYKSHFLWYKIYTKHMIARMVS